MKERRWFDGERIMPETLQVVEERAQGMTYRAIGERHGLTGNRILCIIEEYNRKVKWAKMKAKL